MKLQTVVDLPLLTVRKIFMLRLLTWILFITFPLIFLSLIFWSGKITLVFLVLFAASAIPMQIMRSYETVGTIRLTKDEIIIDNAQEQTSFSVLEADKLEFTVLGIHGEFNRGRSFIMNQGANNFLKFRHMGEKKQFRFLMKEESVNELKRLLELWSENNIPYSLYNKSLQSFPKFQK